MPKQIKLKLKYQVKNNLATTTALITIENKIPNVGNLIKKLTITQKLMKLKIKLLVIILLLQNLISQQQKILKQDQQM